MRLSSIGVLAVGLSVFASRCEAAITVNGASSWSTTNTMSGWLVSITASSSTVTVQTDNSLDIIPIAAIEVTAASGTVQLNVEDGDGTISYVGSISQAVGGSGVLWVTNVTHAGTLGSVTATYIQNLTPAGNITGAITATGNDGGSPNPVSIANIAPTNGNLTGNVTAANEIKTIALVNGNIGTPGGSTVTISAGADIGDIQAKAINANISTGSTNSINTLSTTTGSFEGSLTAYTLAYSKTTYTKIDIKEDLDANITLSQPIVGTAEPRIRVGGAFKSGKTISVPASGLAGQIVFNRNNQGGQWLGTVSIGGSNAFPGAPTYTSVPSSFGGGAVGLASFRFHGEGSSLPHNSYFNSKHIRLTTVGLEPECVDRPLPPIAVQHYGGIEENVAGLYGTTGIYTVQWGGYRDDTSLFYNYDSVLGVVTQNSYTIQDRRVLIAAPSGGWMSNGTYEFTLVRNVVNGATKLLSDDILTGSSTPYDPYVPQYTYRFSILSSCDLAWKEFYELNGDGLLTMGDAVQWFATPVDFNNNGVIDTGDLVKQLEAISTIGDE
jgi:hypothetical protein